MPTTTEIIDIAEKVVTLGMAVYATIRVSFQRNSDKLTQQLEKIETNSVELNKSLQAHILDDSKIQATLVEKVNNIEHNIGYKLDSILDKINE